MKEGSDLDKEAIAAALKKNNLGVASAEKVVRQRAEREISFDFAKAPT